jgi:hypothetical protein
LSFKTGTLHFNGHKMAQRFKGTPRKGTSKNFYYDLRDELVEHGWFEVIREPAPGVHGTYRVLTHSQWVTKHGKDSCQTSPDNSVGADETCPAEGNSQGDSTTSANPANGNGIPARGNDSPARKNDLSGRGADLSPQGADLSCQGDLVRNTSYKHESHIEEQCDVEHDPSAALSCDPLEIDSPLARPQTNNSADDCPQQPQDEAASPVVPLAPPKVGQGTVPTQKTRTLPSSTVLQLAAEEQLTVEEYLHMCSDVEMVPDKPEA